MNSENDISLMEQIILFILLYITSFIFSYVYLSYYIDKRIVKKSLFIFCLIYFSFFINLHFLSNLDLLYNSKNVLSVEDLAFSRFIIENYYLIFNIFSFILKYIIFPFYIGYSKSGYFTKRKKIIDAIFHHYIKLTIALFLIIICIIIFIIYKDQIFDYYGQYKYFLNYLNFLGLIELYLNIGCCIGDLFVLCKKCSKDGRNRIDGVTLEKIYSKTEKSNKKLNKAYVKLYTELIKSNLKNTEINYYNYISLLINSTKENKNLYKINYINENENNNLNITNGAKVLENSNETNNDKSIDNKNNDDNEIINDSIKDNEKENLIIQEKNDDDITEEKEENQMFSLELEKNEGIQIKIDFDKIENEIAPFVRKFKKQMRNIKRLNIVKEIYDYDSNKCRVSKCIKYFLYFFAVIIVFIFDYCEANYKKNKGGLNKKNYRKLEQDSPLLFIAVYGIIVLYAVLNSPFTIILFLFIYKRRLISGDLFYSKHSGDNLNLIYTIKSFAGMALPLVYCNIIKYKIFSDEFNKLFLFDVVVFPDYYYEDMHIMGIIKFSLLGLFFFLSVFFEKIFCYKFNDFGRVFCLVKD